MICSFCGTEIVGEGKSFCPQCGAQLDASTSVVGATNVSNPTDLSYNTNAAPMTATDTAYGTNSTNATYTANPVPVSTPNVGDMPSKGLHIALIVIGFLCGIIWGVIGVVQYKPMMQAVESGDVETANKKANVIKIATGIGVAVNILAFIGMAGSR